MGRANQQDEAEPVDQPTSATAVDHDADVKQSTSSPRSRPDPSAQLAQSRSKFRKVTAACLACRRRKTKCSGPPSPCEACQQHDTECIIDPDADRRRKVPKAILEDLDTHGPALTRLVDALRTPNRSSQALLENIRNGASLPQILAFIDEHKHESAESAVSPRLGPTSSKVDVKQTQGPSESVDPGLLTSPAFPQRDSASEPTLSSSQPISTPSTVVEQGKSSLASMQPVRNQLLAFLQGSYDPTRASKITPSDRHDWHPSLQIQPGTFGSGSLLDSQWLLPDRSTWYPTPGYVTVFGNLSMSSAVQANNYPESVQKLQLAKFNMPEHLILPLNSQDNSLLSNVTTSFRMAAMKMIQDGVPVADVFGPEEPNMDLILRERRPTDSYSVSNWAAELCGSFPAFELPEQLRGAFLFTKYMRWLILPTVENYASLPADYRPTDIQRLIPHAPLIDLQPTCALRDALCLDLRDFLTPQENAISVNWPHADEECLEINPVTGHTQLSPQFREHILDESNLTFSSIMLKTFPELRGRINIRERQPRMRKNQGNASR